MNFILNILISRPENDFLFYSGFMFQKSDLTEAPQVLGKNNTAVSPEYQNTETLNGETSIKERKQIYKVFRRKKLNEMFLFVTSQCNSRCKTCFYHDELNSHQDMTFEEIKRMSETAPEFGKLWLSGGEPFMRKELVEIIKLFYDNNKVREINLPTNGLLTNRIVDYVGRILEECPELLVLLNFSLDGLGATHDKIRGVPGNFRKTIRSMELVKEKYGNDPNLVVNVATVLTPEGYDEAFDLGVYLLKKDLIATQFFEVVRGNPLDPDTKTLSLEQIKALRKKIYPLIEEQGNRLFKHFKGAKRALAKKYFMSYIRFIYNIQDENYLQPNDWKMKCTAGETTIVVDHNGAFRACEIRNPIGNLKDYDFDISKALHGKAMKEEIEAIGGGKKANCWCTHACWIVSSIKFSPKTMLFRIPWTYYKSKGERIKDFQLPDIDIEAIENY